MPALTEPKNKKKSDTLAGSRVSVAHWKDFSGTPCEFWEGSENISFELCTITLMHFATNVNLNVLSHYCFF